MKKPLYKRILRTLEKVIFFPFKRKNWVLIKDLITIKKTSEFLNCISKNKRVYIIASISFDTILYQRPQHMAVNLARLDNLVLYLDDTITYTSKLRENLYLLREKIIFKTVNPLKRNIYIILSSASPVAVYSLRPSLGFILPEAPQISPNF